MLTVNASYFRVHRSLLNTAGVKPVGVYDRTVSVTVPLVLFRMPTASS